MEFLSVKWLWLYAGALLMLLEIMAPGFVIFFFGLAAATVGLTLFAFDFSATAQMALFTAFSIVYIVGLRRFMKALFMGETAESRAISSEYVGRHGKVVEAIRPEVPGLSLIHISEPTGRVACRRPEEPHPHRRAGLTATV